MDSVIVPVLLGVALMLGSTAGWHTGQAHLCKQQFQGEMHEGKCVKVQREEVK